MNPDASEVANDIDDNCDGNVDKKELKIFDDDGDGFSERDGDCNDADELINPNAQDILEDGIDQDCSGADLSCDTTTEENGLLIFPLQERVRVIVNAGNLSASDGKLTARRAQEVEIRPTVEQCYICATRPAIQSNQGGVFTTFDFDDAVMMVYNDYVLFSTKFTNCGSVAKWDLNENL